MGAKQGKEVSKAQKKVKNPVKPQQPGAPAAVPNAQPAVVNPATEPTEADYTFLTAQTGLSRQAIKDLFGKFNANNPDGRLDKKEFVSLYSTLRYEPGDRLDEISEFIFRAFDSDRNGYISFNEFMIAYALTSRGDLRQKLEYAFALYDSDASGFLDTDEVKDVVDGMLDLLGANRNQNHSAQLAAECIKELDASGDGKVSKDEFINGLLKNYSLRALMSPFS